MKTMQFEHPGLVSVFAFDTGAVHLLGIKQRSFQKKPAMIL
jgi:hypothetical protein